MGRCLGSISLVNSVVSVSFYCRVSVASLFSYCCTAVFLLISVTCLPTFNVLYFLLVADSYHFISSFLLVLSLPFLLSASPVSSLPPSCRVLSFYLLLLAVSCLLSPSFLLVLSLHSLLPTKICHYSLILLTSSVSSVPPSC